MKDIFLADAHLGTPNQINYQHLLHFLGSLEGQVRRLFLLGDIFEFWSNFSKVPSTYKPLVEVLERLAAQGCHITWVEGNHDFHLHRYFGRQRNFDILPDGGEVQVDDKVVFIAHGDLADPGNQSYLRLRRILRSPLVAFLTGILPVSLLETIASKMSQESKRRRRSYQEQEELIPLLEKYALPYLDQGAAAVITGHYHTPLYREFDQGVMIALGDWMRDYSYVEHDNGRFMLKSYTPS